MSLNLSSLQEPRSRLDNHPVYQQVNDIDALRTFMTHHVYSVWDFMSLLKYLQHLVAPAGAPWMPLGDPMLRRFVNELVLEEETDEAPGENGEKGYASHFELYLLAMADVGADTTRPLAFLDAVRKQGIDAALASASIPEPARQFMKTTFGFIATGKPHVVGAALALGREHIIPPMFRALLARMGYDAHKAPRFHYYLERHIHLDEDFHAPMSLRLLESLCGGDAAKAVEAMAAARQAMEARIAFWDGVQAALVR
ncbi:MAG TPA: DUF3050 domain-containing protein [Rhodocyclaceae bacterium]